MDYDEFMDRVASELKKEKQVCLNVVDRIYSDEGAAYADRKMADARIPIPGIMDRMAEVERKKMSCYREYQEGAISELTYKKKKGAYAAQLRRLDDELNEVFSELDHIAIMYSDQNPWIAQYRADRAAGIPLVPSGL